MARPKSTKAPGRALTEAELTVLLKERFPAPEYAFIPQVRNGTGYTRRTTRTADALVMSLWPSRGLELYGIEIKSDRADWLREKADPEKAEEIGRFCDRWWVVAGAPDVVQQDDLFPPAWGLMVADVGKLRIVREAPLREALPLDRAQLAAILRRASECVVPKAELDALAEKRIEEIRAKTDETIDTLVKSETRSLRSQLERLQERVAEFERDSGLKIDAWHLGDIGKAARFIADGGLETARADFARWRERARELADHLDAALAPPAAPAPLATGTEG